MQSSMVTVEINGVKMEIDTRHARKIESLRVGSRVKILTKDYGGEQKVHNGIIVGFDAFPDLPTINVCYLDVSYLSADLKFVAFNAKTKDVQMVAANDDDELDVSKADIVARIDKEIDKAREQINELERRRAYFLAHFAIYFGEATATA